MEEVQSWWEVPTIAHFCSIFRAAFNLTYFDVGELEAAILNIQDPEVSISIEQLIIKLLEGCFDEEVNNANWEEKFKELLGDNLGEGENILNENSFHSLTPRLKVEVLFQLCHIRLDMAAAEDLIKDIPSENMQAKCIGQDSEKYSYWYFFDERLYKESPNALKKGKLVSPAKKKVENIPVKNGRRQGTREKKPTAKALPTDELWSIACHNLYDWEVLAQKLVKSKNANEKELAKEIKLKYIDEVSKIINEKEKLLRKRLLELAPKRTSNRISKVQAQRKLEQQMADEAEEQRRNEREKELVKQAALKKVQEKEDRRKRAEERRKIVDERARRAQQRGMLKNFVGDYEDSNGSSECSQNIVNDKRTAIKVYKNQYHSESDSDSEYENESDKSEHSSPKDNPTKNSQCSVENESSEESDNEESSDRNSRNNIKKNVIHTYDLTKWNSTIDTKEPKLHILKTTSRDESDKKRIRINEAGEYKINSFMTCHSALQKENQNRPPFQLSNGNSLTTISPQQVLKIGFLKQAVNKVKMSLHSSGSSISKN